MLQSAAPILASLNADETIAFYTEKLNFNLDANWDGYLIFSRDNIGIHLWPCNNKEIAENTGCYVYVTEVDKLYAEYQSRNMIHPNGPLKEMPWGLKQFSVLDNNGNIINFGERIK
jgi:catechol 2,3-dioxygenase-like lactoylglutathione lyase family enzyme